jgi:hypothetical protein
VSERLISLYNRHSQFQLPIFSTLERFFGFAINAASKPKCSDLVAAAGDEV